MQIGNNGDMYLKLIYVYLKAYEEAIADFEHAVKDAGFADIALMSVKQKYQERVDRVAKELSH
jgi:predicted ABC-type ATPase